jgi:hypothetical protein
MADPTSPWGPLPSHIAEGGLSWSDLPRALKIWKKMLLLDMDYHKISADGLYWKARAAGLVNSSIVKDPEILAAMSRPPKGTRAVARGELVRRHYRDSSARANWMHFWTKQGIANFHVDPLSEEIHWVPKPAKSKRSGAGP